MILFWFKEALRSIGRAKSSFILSLISSTISVMLIVTSLVALRLSEQFESELKEKLTLEVFLNENISASVIDSVEKEIAKRDYTALLKFTSKDEAAETFIKETGEDFRKILDYNPLPASFTVTIKDEFISQIKIDEIVKSLGSMNGVEEVVYQQEFIRKIVSFMDNFKKYIFILTVVLFLISAYILYSTVKLILNTRMEELETMKLVGAKLSTIKMPIIINGVLIGLFASALSLLAFAIAINQVGAFAGFTAAGVLGSLEILVFIALVGPISGLLVSYFSLMKINLKI